MDFNEFVSFFNKILDYRLFVLNQTSVTPSSIIMFLFIMILFIVSSGILKRLFFERLLNKFQIRMFSRQPRDTPLPEGKIILYKFTCFW